MSQALQKGKVFAYSDADQRNDYMRSLGATNIEPPLEHTRFVKIKANGRILPWNPLLAEQQTLVVNCDEFGNEDRTAWENDIVQDEVDLNDADEQRIMAMEKSRRTAAIQAEQITREYRAEDAVTVAPQPTELPPDIVPYDEVQKLMERLEA